MDVQHWTDREAWDAFVADQRHAPFQQSWAWGEFKHQIGTEIIRLAVVNGRQIVGVAQALHEPWHFGQSTLTVFHGPLVDAAFSVGQYQEALGLLLDALVTEAKSRQVISLHLEPPIEQCNEALFKQFEVAHKLKRGMPFQPLDTQVLDLAKSDERLLQDMHEKTRYNIRLAERKGVRVEAVPTERRQEAIETFIVLNRQTTARDRFMSHGAGYYRRLAEHLDANMLAVYVATFEKQPIAASIVVHFGDTTTYVHGASADVSRNVMAPHLLQWRQILDAQLAGKRWYDFFGIETKERMRSSRKGGSWAGITRFKVGFGGTTMSYLSAYELPLKPVWYRLVNARRKHSR